MRCVKCNKYLNPNMDFCPNCGKPINWSSAKQDFGFSKKSTMALSNKQFIFKLALFAFVLIVVFVIAYMLIRMISIQSVTDQAVAQSHYQYLKSGQSYNDNFGNYPGNVTSNSKVVVKNNSYFVAHDDAIYRIDIKGSNSDDVLPQKKLCSGKFVSLNIYEDKLYYIDQDNNCINACDDPYTNEDINTNVFFKTNSEMIMQSLAIVNGNLFLLCKNSSENTISLISIPCKNPIGYEKTIGNFTGQKAWMSYDLSTVKVCVATKSSWYLYKSELNDGNPQNCTQVISGNNAVEKVVIQPDKLIIFENDNDSCRILSYSDGGNREEHFLDFIPNDVISNEDVVFAYGDCGCRWFKTDIFVTTDITDDIDGCVDGSDVLSAYTYADSFGLLCADNKLVEYNVNKDQTNVLEICDN